MKAIRVFEKSASTDELSLACVEVETPCLNADHCLIEVHGSAVNASDVKGILGKMPDLTWPRTPGRDYAGIVVDGPSHLVGKEVWGGGGGDLGMARDGAHAQFLVVEAAAVREKPSAIPLLEAGGIGVPFTCAYMGLVEGAAVQAGEMVAVFGANGKVGEAAIQIATMTGARVIGVEHRGSVYWEHARGPVEVIDGSARNVAEDLLERTEGRGVDIVFNTVGSPYFEVGCACMAKRGRQIIISTLEPEVPIDLMRFYRGNHRLIGVSNMDLNRYETAAIFEKLAPGFESGALKPYPAGNGQVFGLADARQAYAIVLKGSNDRIFIDPQR